jgi:integrase
MPTLDLVKTDLVKLQKTVTERTKFYDTKTSGFFASISPTALTFSVKVWDKYAKDKLTGEVKPAQVPLALGAFDPVKFTAQKARSAATNILADAEAGVNVVMLHRGIVEQAKVGEKTFDEVLKEYIAYISEEDDHDGDGRIHPRKDSWKQDESHLRNASAAFGKVGITKVTGAMIWNLLVHLRDEQKKRGLAKCLRVSLYSLFRWAGEIGKHQYCPVHPMTNLPRQGKRKKREVTVSEDDIRTLWWADKRSDLELSHYDKLALYACQLILATMLRPVEIVAGTKWDAENKTREEVKNLRGKNPQLHIPYYRVKKRRPIVCPLNDLAVGVIEKLLKLECDHGDLFPRGEHGAQYNRTRISAALRGRPNGKPYERKYSNNPDPVEGLCKRLGIKPFKPYDLRHTVNTLLAVEEGELHANKADRGRCLDHIEDGASTTEDYTHVRAVEAAKLKKPTLDKLNAILCRIIGPEPKSNVLPLKRAA